MSSMLTEVAVKPRHALLPSSHAPTPAPPPAKMPEFEIKPRRPLPRPLPRTPTPAPPPPPTPPKTEATVTTASAEMTSNWKAHTVEPHETQRLPRVPKTMFRKMLKPVPKSWLMKAIAADHQCRPSSLYADHAELLNIDPPMDGR